MTIANHSAPLDTASGQDSLEFPQIGLLRLTAEFLGFGDSPAPRGIKKGAQGTLSAHSGAVESRKQSLATEV